MIPVGTNLQRNRFPIATLGIITVNVVVFIIELLLPEQALIWVIQNFGFGPGNLNPLAVLSHMFLHGDIYHISFNMLFLWIFGAPIEERTGIKNYLLYYFGAGVSAGILNLVMELISRPDSTVPCIGASGAISGIMALFLYRCFYSKLKLVINPILLPQQINVPVIPLVLFWFFQDVILGLISISVPLGVAHWAHIGGFIFGIAIGRIKRYGHEGMIEQLRGRILSKLEKGGGWKSAEKDLLKLLDISPDDPEVNLDLARLYSERKEHRAAEKHYLSAIRRYLITDPVNAAYTVIEYADLKLKPLPVQYYLKASEVLVGINEYEDAYRAIMNISGLASEKTQLHEKALLLQIKLCRHLDKTEEGYEGIRIFMENFPSSRYRAEIKSAMDMKPGTVFSHAKAADAAPMASKEEKEAERLGRIEFFERIFADPSFWSILLFLNIATPFLLPGLYSSGLLPVILFAASFVMTVVHRMGSVSDFISFLGRPSEKEARSRVDLKQNFEKAVMAEKMGRFEEAAGLYEEVLKRESKNIQARFNLARLYEKKLDKRGDAKIHYHRIIELLPNDHPFHRDALEAVKEMS